MEYQLSAEEVKKRLDPRLSPPSGMLGGLGALSPAHGNLNQAVEPHLGRIFGRVTSINCELEDVISRISRCADRILPRLEDAGCSGPRPTPTGMLGEIEAAVDHQSDMLVRLRSIAAHLETIA